MINKYGVSIRKKSGESVEEAGALEIAKGLLSNGQIEITDRGDIVSFCVYVGNRKDYLDNKK